MAEETAEPTELDMVSIEGQVLSEAKEAAERGQLRQAPMGGQTIMDNMFLHYLVNTLRPALGTLREEDALQQVEAALAQRRHAIKMARQGRDLISRGHRLV